MKSTLRQLIEMFVLLFRQNFWKAIVTGVIVAYIPYFSTGNITMLLINFAIVSLTALIVCIGVDFIKITLFYNKEN